MTKTNIATLGIILVIALGIIGYVTYESFQTKNQDDTATTTEQQTENQDSALNIERIDAQYQFDAEAGEHTIAGTIQTPTICHVLETDTSVASSSDPVVATVNFDLVNTSEMCAQAIGEARFKQTFEAPENAEIQANLNGNPVELNLVPVPEGENLDDFELFIKG